MIGPLRPLRPHLVALTAAFILALGNMPSRATTVSGDVSGDWTLFMSPIVATADCHVPQGTTLTVHPGVRFLLPPGGSLVVDGNLVLAGTDLFPSSIGPSDAFGVPWRSVVVSATGQATFTHCSIHGGGACLPDEVTGMIRVEGPPSSQTQLGLYDCDIGGSSASGLYINGGAATLSRCRLVGNGGPGPTDAAIHVVTGMLTLGTGPDANAIVNGTYGVYNEDLVPIYATGQWWGASSGPQQVSNVLGTGCPVSDDVLYSGFIPFDPNPGAGDLNYDGSITVSDAAILLKIIAGMDVSTSDEAILGDTVTDGTLNLLDVTRIVREAAGLDPQ